MTRVGTYLRSLAARFLHRHETEDDLAAELESHIQLRADDLVRSGLDRATAERQARVEFGGKARFADEARDAIAGSVVETLVRDLRLSVRQLRTAPSFTTTAIITLAVAIGANAVVFSAVNGFMLRPMNLPHEETLYTLERADRDATESYPNYVDLRDRNRAFDGLAAFTLDQGWVTIGRDGDAIRSWLFEVSGNYFDVVGVQPYLGRFFHAGDEHGANSVPYAVLTYAYWRNHFQGDHGIVGRTVLLNRHPFTIIGVAPPAFRGTVLIFAADLFVPLVDQEQIDGASLLNDRANRWLTVLGHRKGVVTPAQAVADLNEIAAQLQLAYPKEDENFKILLTHSTLGGDAFEDAVHAFLVALMLLASLILLAACANLGSLFAARAADRSREVALRLALGAGSGRILRQLFTESVLIALVGGAVGLWGSVLVLSWLANWHPFPQFSIRLPIDPDARVYVVALLLSIISGFVFGAVPVRQVLRTDPYQVVKSGSANPVRRRMSIRDLLLGVQIAICAVLVTFSIVAVRGLSRSLHGNLGVDPHNVLLVDTDLRMAGYSKERISAMQQRMLAAIRAVPRVTSVGLVGVSPPMHVSWNETDLFPPDAVDLKPSKAAAHAIQYSVSPDYFHAAGTRLLAGRTFTVHDDTIGPRVAIVNELLARKLYGSGASAIDRVFKLPDGKRVQIVGIAEDGKYTANLGDATPLAIFFPLLQVPSNETWMVVRSPEDPQQLSAAIRGQLRALDSGLPSFIETWTKDMSGALFAPRVAAVSLGVLGLMGAIVAVTGIFGTAAYSLSKRLKELGIRTALGAQRMDVIEAALGRAFRVLALGSLVGLVLGLLASRVLASIVYQASPRDPLVLIGAVVAMFMLGLVATWIPARRALAVDPLILLRAE